MKPRWIVLLILCVPTALWIACWPFVDSPVNDDFSYAFTVRRLLETGTFTYNGWSSAMLGPQALWGASFAWIFGFSHDVLRVSTLPISIACTGLAYGLHRRLGIAPNASLFAALLLACSPLFTAWSASFMTDIPGLLFTLVLFHCLVGGMRTQPPSGVFWWGASLCAAGLVGGTIRQSLFVLGFTGLALMLIRHSRNVQAKSALLLLGGLHVAVTICLVRWQMHQPYSIAEAWPAWHTLPNAILPLIGILLELCLYLLPLAFALLRISRIRSRNGVIVFVLVAAAVFMINALLPGTLVARLAHGLWIGDTITPTGMLLTGFDTPGIRPIIIDDRIRLVLGAAVFSTLILGLLILMPRVRRFTHAFENLRSRPWSDRTSTLFSLITLGAVYLGLLIPRATFYTVYDRYLLVLIPIASIVLLSFARKQLAAEPVSRAAWAALGVYACAGVVFTHDHLAELRARDRLVSRLLRDGAERTQIVNGLAYDGWTQLHAQGYLNDARIHEPPDAYVNYPGRAERGQLFWFLAYCPKIEPQWIVLSWTSEREVPARGACESYRALLPPFKRWLVLWPLTTPATTSSPAAAETNKSSSTARVDR